MRLDSIATIDLAQTMRSPLETTDDENVNLTLNAMWPTARPCRFSALMTVHTKQQTSSMGSDAMAYPYYEGFEESIKTKLSTAIGQ
jgi:hypothetical protein